jgi:hypothetical protein
MGKKGFGTGAAPSFIGKGDLPGFVKKSGSASSLAGSARSENETDREDDGWDADGWDFDNDEDTWLDGGSGAKKTAAKAKQGMVAF